MAAVARARHHIQSWRAQALIITPVFKAIPFRDGFSIAP
nr:MAG TPA: hypothetical protein [Caudoviricetes sp.]